jgi:glycosyltransferase involved in cell wall biosynthesis
MISILIPVYNYDIVALVHNLRSAIGDIPEYREILIGDDGSSEEYRNRYMQMCDERVRLVVSEKNIGRSAIRNRIAGEAIGEYLLFIDADALIVGTAEEYLKRYVGVLKKAKVICGGVLYPGFPPADPDKMLRWKYGKQREQRKASDRNKHPHARFSGFNFIVEKETFMKIRFNEELKQYGHEDTLLGYQLKIAGIGILHIDNGLIHDGVEFNADFIAKTKQGIENLSILCDKVTDRRSFAQSVRLVWAYDRLRYFGITRFLAGIYIRYRERMEISLDSSKASLIIFGLFKMSLFSTYREIHRRRNILPVF